MFKTVTVEKQVFDTDKLKIGTMIRYWYRDNYNESDYNDWDYLGCSGYYAEGKIINVREDELEIEYNMCESHFNRQIFYIDEWDSDFQKLEII